MGANAEEPCQQPAPDKADDQKRCALPPIQSFEIVQRQAPVTWP